MATPFLPPSPPSSPAPAGAHDPKIIDSPLMRSAGRELLSLALMDARNHTLHLFAQYQKAIDSGHRGIQPLQSASPPQWTLGHIGWFQEWWLGRNLQRAMGQKANASAARLSSIEPNADQWWNPAQSTPASRWSLALPDTANSRAYLLDTLEASLELLEKTGTAASEDSGDALYFFRMCLFHEDMQAELLVSHAQAWEIPLDRPLMEAFTPAPMALREPMLVPATIWTMGSSDAGEGFAFDNEMPRHSISVPEFEIDAQPVSWSQFVEFVDDGAYDREELWHADGWQWLQELARHDGRRGPRYVDQIGVASGAVMQTRFGRPMRMLGNQPAMHVSWWEADAWCRWAGRRLPAEVEWEVAAHTAARRGFQWGQVWEWTGTTFRPYAAGPGHAGFAAGPWADYSQPFFGSHKVLRGASFATRARMKNPRFRNFQLPGEDGIFCGFRSCAL